MNYNVGNHVKLIKYGSELSSTSLRVGDKGEVKRIDLLSTGVYYFVTFSTCNGPRNQWVKEENLAPASTTLDSCIEALEKELKALKRKREEDQWVDITHECVIKNNFNIYHKNLLLLNGYTQYKTEGMKVFKKKERV